MSTKPNIPLKTTGDKLTAEEVNTLVNFFEQKPDPEEIPEAINGKSAYQLAVDNGFEGTEQEWLASLEGPKGETGPAGSDATATTDASQLTSGYISPDRTEDGSIEEVKLSEEVRGKLGATSEIIDKIDFTGLEEGDILRHDGTKLVRVTPTEILRQKESFVKSGAIPPIGSWKTLQFWDNFNRIDENPIGLSDCGIAYVSLLGTGFRVENGVGKFNQDQNILGIPCSPTGFMCQITRSFHGKNSFYAWKDQSNYYEIDASSSTGQIKIDKVVDGVRSNLLTSPTNTDIPSVTLNEATYIFGYYSGYPISSRRRIFFGIKEIPQSYFQVNVESDISVFEGQLTHAAFSGRNTSPDKTTSVYLSNNYYDSL